MIISSVKGLCYSCDTSAPTTPMTIQVDTTTACVSTGDWSECADTTNYCALDTQTCVRCDSGAPSGATAPSSAQGLTFVNECKEGYYCDGYTGACVYGGICTIPVGQTAVLGPIDTIVSTCNKDMQ